MKKFLAVLLAAVVTCTSAIALGGCTETVVKKNEGKTQLYIGNYSGGVGTKWLDDVKIRFEEQYEDYEFEPGKKGAQLMIDHNKKYENLSLTQSIATDQTYEVYFMGGSDYFGFVGNKTLYDLTDVVKEKVGLDGETIASKMNPDELEAMTVDGKIYAVPHYELYDGPSYDANLFEMNALYFMDEVDTADTTYPGTRKFIPSQTYAGRRSCGPNGVYGDYDDGLPSSVAEFCKLIDKMAQKNIKGFISTGGASAHYTNQVMRSLYASLGGPALINATYHLDSKGEPIDYVDGFNKDGTPIIKQAVITEENAYLVKQSAAIYYALKFAQHVRSNDSHIDKTGFSLDHIETQSAFVNSGPGYNQEASIAMLIDGSWWWNEANDDGIFDRFEEDYPETFAQKEFRMMPMPVKYEGTVNEGEGRAPTIPAGISSLCIVNKNIDENHVKIMKEFISFVYTQDELLKFTETTNGTIKGINYNYKTLTNKLKPFAQSVLEIIEESKEGNGYIRTFSNNPMYLKWSAPLTPSNNQWLSNGEISFPIYSYDTKTDLEYVRDHFNALKIQPSAWK